MYDPKTKDDFMESLERLAEHRRWLDRQDDMLSEFMTDPADGE